MFLASPKVLVIIAAFNKREQLTFQGYGQFLSLSYSKFCEVYFWEERGDPNLSLGFLNPPSKIIKNLVGPDSQV
jgi:hypothetical protein